MEGKSSTQKADIERFRQLIMSNLTLVSGPEFEFFLYVDRDWNGKISQNVPNLGFLKRKDGFFPKTCMISVDVEIFLL